LKGSAACRRTEDCSVLAPYLSSRILDTLCRVGVNLLLVLLVCSRPLYAASQHVARSGTVNYLEGDVNLGSQPLNSDSIGTAEIDPGETITTGKGKVEVLLMPGVFLRLGESSSATMIAAGMTSTRLSLDYGEAFLEIAEIHPETDLRIQEDGVWTEPIRPGLYNFNATLHVVRVLDGKAEVYADQKSIRVETDHMLDLDARPLKARKFEKKEVEAEDLYRWSSLRSAYLAEANADYAPKYMYGGFGWYGDGWYWDPWFGAYTFLPSDGVYYSSFGWGFYSPFCIYTAPFIWSAHSYHHFSSAYGTVWGKEAHYVVGSHTAHSNVTQGVSGHEAHYAAGYHASGAYRAKSSGHGAHGLVGAIHGGFHGGGGVGHSGGGGGHK
jgi:hypothetical protein